MLAAATLALRDHHHHHHQTHFEAATSRTVRQQIKLSHLRSLYTHLRESMHGDPLDAVHVKYREELGDRERGDLQAATKYGGPNGLDVAVMAKVLREFMVMNLQSVNQNPDNSLKENLAWMESPDGDFLNDVPWFVKHFPESLKLMHSFDSLVLLRSIAQ